MKISRSSRSRSAAPLRRMSLALLLGGAALTAGCFGEFPLTHSLLYFNRNVSPNEFNRNLTFWVASPAYVIVLATDLAILNPIEFWSGEALDFGLADKSLASGPRGDSGGGEGVHLILKRADSEQTVVVGPLGATAGSVQVQPNGDILVRAAGGAIVSRFPAPLGMAAAASGAGDR